MSHTRRRFVKDTLVATGGLLVAACLPAKSYGSCASEEKLLPGSASFVNGVTIHSWSVDNWRLGDCELKNALITFRKHRGVFTAQVCTHFTHTKDVWHFRIQLFTGNPTDKNTQSIRFDKSWDGPEMSELDNPLFHAWREEFTIDPSINLGKVWLRAISCC
jgi:hypothetical protein